MVGREKTRGDETDRESLVKPCVFFEEDQHGKERREAQQEQKEVGPCDRVGLLTFTKEPKEDREEQEGDPTKSPEKSIAVVFGELRRKLDDDILCREEVLK